MRILYIYRHPDMGFSIGKVFKTIENEMKKYAEVDTVYMPCANYKPLGMWRNIKAARAAVRRKHYDIVHITGAEHYLLPFLKKENTVVTVHDLGFFTNTGGLSVRSAWKYVSFIQTLKCAKCCTFISDKSHHEALQYVKLKDGQHITIHNPVDPSFKYVPKKIETERPRILHIGNTPNKNLENTILALRGLSCHLRIVGKINDSQEQLLRKNDIDYSTTANLSDEQLLKEYEMADIINFPSLYEGFGMPIIEGQAVGRPVITSNIEPMRSIAGSSAELVNPSDTDDIRRGYKKILNAPNKYVELGLENIKRFEVNNICKQYMSLYKTI